MIQIRLAIAEDIPVLVAMGRQALEETRYQAFKFDETKVRKSAEAYMADQRGKYGILVAVDDGKIVGYLFAMAEAYWFCDSVVATNISWFVLPEARGTSAATKLVLGFQRWAKNRGADEVRLMVSSGYLIDRTDKMLRRMGFSHVGGNYALSLKTESN
ncbi:GNAT family N-acetyltransferase [uncultured Chitinibacter sp.]|uniref:GNAT family N-acetyltransferase n=1 Tax=uncultured Chitinibacter sp. TaxID=1214081 RepID=UPI0025943E79|nr:GNAT family N-acetyltransferase [uncultured Chitinibacter sp.]